MKINRFVPWMITLALIITLVNSNITSAVAEYSASDTSNFQITITPTPTIIQVQPDTLGIDVDVEPETLVKGQVADVSITLLGQGSSDCSGIPAYPLDLFILIDNSSSAGQGPGSNWAKTQMILSALVDELSQEVYVNPDFNNLVGFNSRIGIAATKVGVNGTEIDLQPLSENYSEVKNSILSLNSSGDTEMAEGINKVHESLNQIRRSDAVPVILLALHDNVPLDSLVADAVKRAQDDGIQVYLYVNSLQIEPERQINNSASGIVDPDHVFMDLNQPQLHRAFVNMTGGNPDAIASGIYINSIWLPGLDYNVTAQIPSVALPNGAFLLVPELNNNETAFMQYSITVPYDTTDPLTHMLNIAYIGCNGLAQNKPLVQTYNLRDGEPSVISSPQVQTPGNFPTIASSTPGPGTSTPQPPRWDISPLTSLLSQILGITIPPLGAFWEWLLLLLLFLLLIFFLWKLIKWLLNRNRKPLPPQVHQFTPLPNPTPKNGGDTPMPSGLAWIKRLTRAHLLVMDAQNTIKPELTDTVVIGVGNLGKEVIAQLASDLHGRFGESLPNNIRLLQVDVQPYTDESSIAVPSGITHDQWVLMRPKLDEMLKALREKPEEFARWSWMEAANSAGYGDRCLGRMALHFDLKNGTTDSRLWPKLERALLGLNNPTICIVGSTFDNVSSGMLVDLARIIQIAAVKDHQIQFWLCGPLRRDWIDKIGNKSIRLDVQEQEVRTLATMRELEQFQGNAPISYVYVSDKHPQEQLRKIYNFAVVQSVLIFGQDGSNPPEDDVLCGIADSLSAIMQKPVHDRLNEHWNSNRHQAGNLMQAGRGMMLQLGTYSIRIPVHPLQHALAWRLVRDGLFEAATGLFALERCNLRNGSYEPLDVESSERPGELAARRADANQLAESFVIKRMSDRLFGESVALKVEKMLNGSTDSGEPIFRRRSGYQEACSWLEMLNSALKKQGVRSWTPHIEQLIQELSQWHDWFVAGVYPACQREHKIAQEQLDKMRRQESTRQWLSLDDNLEWSLYQSRNRKWSSVDSIGNPDGEPLVRFGMRFGWHVRYQDGHHWDVQFLAMPGDFEWHEDANLQPYELNRGDTETLLGNLYRNAYVLARSGSPFTVAEQLNPQDASHWVAIVEKRLEEYYNVTVASEKSGVQRVALLISNRSEVTNRLKEKIQNTQTLSAALYLCEIPEQSFVTLIYATNYLPMDTSAWYSPETWQRNTVMPGHYVWPAEQKAANLELGASRRLSARFLKILTVDPELLEKFTLGYIYDVFNFDEALAILGDIEIQGTEPLEILQNLLSQYQDRDKLSVKQSRIACLDNWRILIEEKKQELGARRLTYLRERKDTIEKQQKTPYRIDEDFALYLLGLIEQEK